MVADADLTRAGFAHGHVNQTKFFGSAVLADLCGKAHGKRLQCGGVPGLMAKRA